MSTSPAADHAVIVGRFVRRPGIDYPAGTPDAITVERYWHPAGQHDAWRVVSTWNTGAPRERAVIQDHDYHHASAACETAGALANIARLGWDRESFPNGLVR